MPVGPIPVSSNSFFERVFACPVAHGREGGRAAQSSAEGWAWQVLGRARQSRAAPARAGQRMAEAGRVSAGHCRVERREQGKGWGRAAQRTEQSRGWAGQSSDWAEPGLGMASPWFAEWQSRAVQGQRRGWAGQRRGQSRAGAWQGRAGAGQSRGFAGQRRGSTGPGQGRAGPSQGRAVQRSEGFSSRFDRLEVPSKGSNGHFEYPDAPSGSSSSLFECLGVPSGGSNNHCERPEDTERGLEYPF